MKKGRTYHMAVICDPIRHDDRGYSHTSGREKYDEGTGKDDTSCQHASVIVAIARRNER